MIIVKEFQCKRCNHEFAQALLANEENEVTCPKCGATDTAVVEVIDNE